VQSECLPGHFAPRHQKFLLKEFISKKRKLERK